MQAIAGYYILIQRGREGGGRGRGRPPHAGNSWVLYPHSKLDHHAGYTGTWDLRLGKYKPTSQLHILIKDHHTGLIINAHQPTHRNKTFYREQASLKATNYTHIGMQQVGGCVCGGIFTL